MNPPFRVLWICTANACRSQMAEAILRDLGGHRFIARSAGASPAGYIHPLAIAGLKSLGLALGNQRSKGCDEMLPLEHDIVITVCDAAACVIPGAWKGDPVVVHWGLPDPVACPDPPAEREAQAAEVAARLRNRIKHLVELPLETMDREQIRQALEQLAHSK